MKINLPKKRTWIERNPRLFIGVTTTAALLVFFSRPIYDIFISKNRPDIQELKKQKPRFG